MSALPSVFAAALADREYRVHGSGIDMPGRNLIAGLTWRYGRASGPL
jgi:hypothetical protein